MDYDKRMAEMSVEQLPPGGVPKVDILRDLRVSLEDNWEFVVVPAIREAQERGNVVTPKTVFNEDGYIIGWHLHGWDVPPPHYIYEPEKLTV